MNFVAMEWSYNVPIAGSIEGYEGEASAAVIDVEAGTIDVDADDVIDV